jgi:hypothetical protein
MLLGAALGLALALALSRLFASLAPVYTVAALVAGSLVGLAVTAGVVRIRGLLRDRSVLDRWVSDVIEELRAAVEQLAAARVLSAEPALIAELAELDEAEAGRLADRVGAIDTELRDHGLAAARAAARRNRDLPALQGALDAVRAELGTEPTAGPATEQEHEHFG